MESRRRISDRLSLHAARTLAAVAVAATIGLLALVPPAIASTHPATLFWNRENHLCLNSTSRGHVFLGNCNGSNDWYRVPGLSLVDRHFGLKSGCLEATHIRLGGVYTRKCDSNSIYQTWVPYYANGTGPQDGFYYRNYGTNQCLVGGSRHNVYMHRCLFYSDTRQHWGWLPGD
jgi:hypothetical protein